MKTKVKREEVSTPTEMIPPIVANNEFSGSLELAERWLNTMKAVTFNAFNKAFPKLDERERQRLWDAHKKKTGSLLESLDLLSVKETRKVSIRRGIEDVVTIRGARKIRDLTPQEVNEAKSYDSAKREYLKTLA